MSLSNFNQYRDGSEKAIEKDNRIFLNFLGLNVLVVVFSLVFNIFNTILISFVFDSR
jgi:hypothetical protein